MTHPIKVAVSKIIDDDGKYFGFEDDQDGLVAAIVAEVLRLAREPSEKVQDAILIMPAWRAGIDALAREVEESR